MFCGRVKYLFTSISFILRTDPQENMGMYNHSCIKDDPTYQPAL